MLMQYNVNFCMQQYKFNTLYTIFTVLNINIIYL